MDSSLARRISQRQQLAGTPLFDGPPPVEEERQSPVTPVVQRRRKSRAIQEAGARRWINAGKPIALEVARKNGFVTAETYRAAAGALGKLPPTYDNQRALSWIPALFSELVREGQLQKRRREDGSVIKRYSAEQGNDQVEYELVGVAR